jgi:hypothetical protein
MQMKGGISSGFPEDNPGRIGLTRRRAQEKDLRCGGGDRRRLRLGSTGRCTGYLASGREVREVYGKQGIMPTGRAR